MSTNFNKLGSSFTIRPGETLEITVGDNPQATEHNMRVIGLVITSVLKDPNGNIALEHNVKGTWTPVARINAILATIEGFNIDLGGTESAILTMFKLYIDYLILQGDPHSLEQASYLEALIGECLKEALVNMKSIKEAFQNVQ